MSEHNITLEYGEYLDDIKIKNDHVWNEKTRKAEVEKWLENFNENERTYALYILSKFTFYKNEEIEWLARSAYNLLHHEFSFDLEKKNNSQVNVRDYILSNTRFFPMGGHTATSGTMLQYGFSKINKLPRTSFLESLDNIPANVHEIVFIDDILASGDETERYWDDVISNIQKDDLVLYYIPYLGLTAGVDRAKQQTKLKVMPVITISKMNQVFSNESIYFQDPSLKSSCRRICQKHGKNIFPTGPLGFGDSQLLIGFEHNIPDNTLPIIWKSNGWTPIFKRR